MKLTLITVFFITTVLYGQENFPAFPEKEKTVHFSFEEFERQPSPPLFLEKGIQNLSAKARKNWNATDSLYFAFKLAYIHDYEHALSYFNRLNTDTLYNESTLVLYQLTLRKTKRYQTLLKSLTHESKKFPERHQIIKVRKRLADVRSFKRDLGWKLDSNTIFPTLKDPENIKLRDSEKSFKQVLIPRANAYKYALRYDVLYTDETDKVLSKAYEEFGDFLNEYFYISNAFIAYSIARHFDKRNNEAQKKLKKIKKELNENNYLLPSFINKFQRLDADKYDYKLNKELLKVYNDSISGNKEGKYLELDELLKRDKVRKDYLPWLDLQAGVILVLTLLLIIVVFGVRSKRKK